MLTYEACFSIHAQSFENGDIAFWLATYYFSLKSNFIKDTWLKLLLRDNIKQNVYAVCVIPLNLSGEDQTLLGNRYTTYEYSWVWGQATTVQILALLYFNELQPVNYFLDELELKLLHSLSYFNG